MTMGGEHLMVMVIPLMWDAESLQVSPYARPTKCWACMRERLSLFVLCKKIKVLSHAQ